MPKKALLIAIGFAISLTATISALHVAKDKAFWLDEIYGFYSLRTPVTQMLSSGAEGQWSGSPLYYIVQRTILKSILHTEQKEGFGFDWRMSFRFFVAFFLGLAAFLS